jgi:hypothetical protein
MQTKSSRKQRSYNDIIKIDFKIRGVTRDTEEFHNDNSQFYNKCGCAS